MRPGVGLGGMPGQLLLNLGENFRIAALIMRKQLNGWSPARLFAGLVSEY